MKPVPSPRVSPGMWVEKGKSGNETVILGGGKYTVEDESFDSLVALWRDPGNGLRWECLFVIPIWLEPWWSVFGAEWTRHICSVREGGDLLGIAPLMLRDQTAYLIGDSDVSDYLDFIVVPGREREFFTTLLAHLQHQAISRMHLKGQRPGSTVERHLLPLLECEGYPFSWEQEDVTFELDLPATWEEFLGQLNGKQRHEVRRKMRRVSEAGDVRVRKAHEERDIEDGLGTFFEFFRLGREDKAAFLTSRREAFFRKMTAAVLEARLLRLYVCEVGGCPAAAVMCFDYGQARYLYNNGYDPRFRSLSVGTVSKLLTIKDSIAEGRMRYDFLRGNESYKRHLGGKPVPLFGLSVELR
jgi:CelD/BcsL family acetyltransferase involved in cellulose biosynthesis